jgi:outer membrane cobalamin receptor
MKSNNKKRQIVSRKVREYVRSIMNKRNIDQMNMEDLRNEFIMTNHNNIKLTILNEEYQKTITYKRTGRNMTLNFWSYNDRFRKLLRDGGLLLVKENRKMVIILE